MTYMTRGRRHVVPPRRGALGGIADLFTKSEESVCLDRANAAVAPMDAKIDDLVRNWNPTGFFLSSEIRELVIATMRAVSQAQDLVNRAAAEPNASQESVMRASNDLGRAGQRSLVYLDSAKAADQQGLRLVNAPGIKRWVTDTLATCSSAVVTASVIGCLRPWWVSALAAFQSAFDVVFGVAKRVVGAVLAIGETALKVVSDLPDLYGILKWMALAGVGYWGYTQIRGRAP